MIEIQNLSKQFGNKKIFEQFNCGIEEGKITAIVGKSGSGKTTLLNILGLLDMEYDGQVLYNGISISNYNEKKRTEYIRNNINYLFQNYALIDNETVLNNLLLALTYQKFSKEEKIKKIENVLEQVGLKGYQSQKVFTLSGGEQQRIALARVLLKKGDIVLADEPTGNLDEENSQMVFSLLQECKSMGKTIIIATHNEALVKKCDKIIQL